MTSPMLYDTLQDVAVIRSEVHCDHMEGPGIAATLRLWGCGKGRLAYLPVAASPRYTRLKMAVNYALYPQNWLSEIRPAILRRAGWDPHTNLEARCELCNVLNHSTRKACGFGVTSTTLIVLTIAHLDQDIQNNDPRNLMALCQRCHLLHDRPHHLINASLTRDRKRKQSLFAMFSEREKREMMSTKGPNHSFNVLLSPHHMTLLQELALKTSTNKSIIIRQAIAGYHAMKVQGIPTCSDGQACRVPNMHPVPGQPAAPVAP